MSARWRSVFACLPICSCRNALPRRLWINASMLARGNSRNKNRARLSALLPRIPWRVFYPAKRPSRSAASTGAARDFISDWRSAVSRRIPNYASPRPPILFRRLTGRRPAFGRSTVPVFRVGLSVLRFRPFARLIPGSDLEWPPGPRRSHRPRKCVCHLRR